MAKKTSTSETGHAKNVANFDDLITIATGMGAAYNPSDTKIKLAALNTLHTNADNSNLAVEAALPTYTNAVDNRQAVFLPVKKLTTRIMSALASSGASAASVADAKTIARKLQGTRATPIKNTTPSPTPSPSPAPSAKTISVSQQSFDSQYDNMNKLVQLLTTISSYTPNETDLKLTALNSLVTSMKAQNKAVATAFQPVVNARNARNTVLYTPTTGLVDIAQSVKNYIKSVYGATSPQYKQAAKIKFTTPKD